MPYGLASLCERTVKRIWIVWAEDNVARNWTIPVNWNIESAEILDGTSFRINGNSIQIGMAPVFLVSRDSAK